MTKILEAVQHEFQKISGARPPTTDNGAEPEQPRQKLPGTQRLENARLIPTSLIVRDPRQPRKQFDPEKLTELEGSIKEHGILQPISVRFDQATEKYIIISGERRWKASNNIGLAEMPCWVKDDIKDESDRLAKQLIENLQREDLSPIDKALGILEYKKALGIESTWQQVEQKLGISETRRKQFIQILNLPEDMQSEIVALGHKKTKNQVTEKHARALLKLNKFPDKQAKLFDQIRGGDQTISGDRAMEIAKKWLAGKQSVSATPYVYSVKYRDKKELLEILETDIKKIKAELSKRRQ